MASSHVVMVRMNKELAARFEGLRREFEGLPPSTIIRMLITASLSLPLEVQVEIVTAQIRKPGSRPALLKRWEHVPNNTRKRAVQP